MLFNSLTFLFYFLPFSLVVYYASGQRLRNGILLFLSLVFYAWGGVSYSIILIGSVLANFGFASMIAKQGDGQRLWLRLGVTVNVLLLVIFKYLDFFIDNLNWGLQSSSVLEEAIPYSGIVLPLGISFFTFQQMSMLWDIYRSNVRQHIGFLDTALYVSLFPQLIAGPIVRYNSIVEQIRSRQHTMPLFVSGLRRFITGLGKKVIFANGCAVVADSIMDLPAAEIDPSVALLGIGCYSLQIYFDFGGYSDMAIGLCRMFGFSIPENFNFPYLSKSIQEFWRRWHISLSTWFRDYVYIPLGGNRKGEVRTYVNLLIVFILTGFWHGASWSFIVWGLFHGLFLIIERLGLGNLLNRLPGVLAWAYMLFVVLIGWIFFRIERVDEAIDFISVLFDLKGWFTEDLRFWAYLDNEKIIILLLALLGSSQLMSRLYSWGVKRKIWWSNFTVAMIGDVLLIVLFIYIVVLINSNSYSPFIYFRF